MYQLSEYQTTVNALLADEENAPAEAALDVAMNVDSDEEDEEQAMLASMSQNLPKTNQTDDTPMMKEIVVYMNGGLVPGKNLDVLGFWRNHEKQFPLLAKVDTILLSIMLLYNSCKRYIYRLLSIMLLYNSCKRYIYRFITENMNSGQFPARLYIIEYYHTLLAITV